jgi:hypothetical protein
MHCIIIPNNYNNSLRVANKVTIATINIDIDLVDQCLHDLGKTAGLDGIEPEHLLYSHPVLQCLLF